ncbi:divalent-cation tolerance protein CutA [Rhodovulum visakhapatnamense]|uniref:Periplasmic divalent cation tolerance protein n=1 Tax=Rhodovulum visakhapatnamense TaxID=364297 RepID=A0A4R8FL44_9RHOB|nr:divalent-cation tolerance protein CutA [Rhodovulum visakhapatnamense]TDX22891.1 periplasmic divalent cation tolerance protein [Rhodovulum visakhapatnamense]
MIHVVTTCPDIDSARAIARAALDRRLAACANILPGVVSLFHWQDRIDEEPELQLTLKTDDGHRAALVSLIAETHPHDLPVITWETVETTPEAAAWLTAETSA